MTMISEETATPVTKISSSTGTETTNKKRDEENKFASKQNHHVGVADYFAILGVGQDLIWKHAGIIK